MTKTKFFHSCLGVFQGGGCRAAALVGAYEEAIKRGVQFIEVAGTSAGAIVAALVGAGATPEQLTKFVSQLDFRTFLKPPEISKPLSFLTRLATKPFGRLSDLLFHQGIYSSSEVEKWVEKCLREILGDRQGPTPFAALPLPTSIVATDILTRKTRIWNPQSSPNESVAKAVRASCSIPIFFQPVDRQFVDGGALSNLPTFVFSNNAVGRPLASRILAFVLAGDDETIDPWGTLPFLKAVANTVVEGSQDLQLRLFKNVHAIVIPTGTIKATDFDSIDDTTLSALFSAGKKASAEFLQTELRQVRDNNPPTVCHDREDLFNNLTTHLDDDVREVVISDFDTSFVYNLFPSLLLWKMRGARLQILLPTRERRADHGNYRRALLREIGAEVVEVDSPPFRGFLINCHEVANGTAYIGDSIVDARALIYRGAEHAYAINSLHEKLAKFFAAPPPEPFLPRVSPAPQDALLKQLRNVSQYNRQTVRLTLESIPLSNLRALTNYVHEYKYRQIEHLVRCFNDNHLSLFQSAVVELSSNRRSLVTPPVVEDDGGGGYVLIEGSTRARFLSDNGMERIECVVARGISDPLPSDTLPFSRVRIVGRNLDPDFRYDNFNYKQFRNIELAAHPLNSFQ